MRNTFENFGPNALPKLGGASSSIMDGSGVGGDHVPDNTDAEPSSRDDHSDVMRGYETP